MDMQSFQRFCSEQFPFIAHLSALKDGRMRPQIAPEMIFKVLFYGGVLGFGSLLGIDQFLRTRAGKALFKRLTPFVSDSTLSRSLEGMDRPGLHRLLQRLYQTARIKSPSRLPIGLKRLRVGLIDGSCFGRMYACCFAQISSVCLMADCIRMKNQGKELPTAKKLLHRLVTRFGAGFVDVLLLDGIYFAQDFIRYALAQHIDVLIKTKEDGLLIIQDAMGLITAKHPQRFGVRICEGTDLERMRTYKASAVDGLFQDGIEAPFTVCYVHEQDIKTGTEYDFFVLTTLQGLSPDEIRKLGHERWQVENNGFKTLNHLVHTKHLYAHEPNAQEAMILILMMAANLLQLFDLRISDQALISALGKVKRTKRLMQQLIRQSLLIPAPDT